MERRGTGDEAPPNLLFSGRNSREQQKSGASPESAQIQIILGLADVNLLMILRTRSDVRRAGAALRGHARAVASFGTSSGIMWARGEASRARGCL